MTKGAQFYTAPVGGIRCWSWNWMQYHLTCLRKIFRASFPKNMAVFCFAHLQSCSDWCENLLMFFFFFRLEVSFFLLAKIRPIVMLKTPAISNSPMPLQSGLHILSTLAGHHCTWQPWVVAQRHGRYNFWRWKGFIQFFFMAPLIVKSPTI